MADTAGAWVDGVKGMSGAEIRALLQDKPIIARVATLNEDGSPHLIPIWFDFDGERITSRIRAKSAAMQNLLRDPRFSLSIADDNPPYARLSIQGKAEILYGPGPIVEPWLAAQRRNTVKYLGEEALAYLGDTAERPRYVVQFTPEKATAWNKVAWHARYA